MRGVALPRGAARAVQRGAYPMAAPGRDVAPAPDDARQAAVQPALRVAVREQLRARRLALGLADLKTRIGSGIRSQEN